MTITRKDRMWLMAGGATAAIIIALGWFFFVSPQHAQASDYRSQLAAAQTKSITIHHQINQLKSENSQLPQYQSQLAADEQALPSTPDLPNFLRQMQAIGITSGVSVTGINVTAPSAITASGQSAPSAATTGTKPATAGGPLYDVNIILTVTGSPTAVTTFTQQLQQVQPRAVLITSASEVNGTSTSATTTNGLLTLKINLQAFVAPSTANDAAATAGK